MLRLFASLLCCFAVSLVHADEAGSALATLDHAIMPVLERSCFECHDSSLKKADIDLEALKDPGAARLDVRLWGKVREVIKLKTMPPAKKKEQPTDAERQALLSWIGSAEKAVLTTQPTDPGPHKTRRLNRNEYGHTLRDLLGIGDTMGEKFPRDGGGGEGFDNNADTLFLPVLLIEKYIEAADDAIGQAYAKPELKARLIKQRPDGNVTPAAAAQTCLHAFAFRAYRRPVTDVDVKPLVSVFDQAGRRGLDFDAALRVAFKAVLVSPKFLFLQEAAHPGAKEPWRVDGYEMASRLSYFLWSTCPDEELYRLAHEGRLGETGVIAQQVKRMLADVRAAAFAKHFSGQWLRYEELYNTVDPDRNKFKAFNDSLRQAMYDEALHFSDAVLRQNGRVLDFLDSNYTFVNEELARFYGWPGVQGKEFRRVNMPDARRGGVLGMAAILTSTAYPQRTSPVLRGKWVLEQLLGTPAPPPPASVAKLPEDDRKLNNLTFRQTLEKHRSKAECMGCHSRMDPPGFGLENFNAIGQWRDNENGKPLDATGVMPDGQSFGTPAELRKILIGEKAKFIRNYCTRLLGYALGRGLETYDQPTLLRLEQTLEQNGWKSEPLIIAVAQSYPFTHRKAASAPK